MSYKVLHVGARDGFYRMTRFPLTQVLGPVDAGLELYEKTAGITIGAGLLAGSVLPGSNRLMVCGRSPAWGGFYISSMGGASLIFDNLGINALHISGKHPTPAVLVLNREHGEEVQVRLEPVPLEEVWAGDGERVGFYALQDWVWERFAGEYKEVPRILATGPSAASTDMGALGSLVPKRSGLTHVDTWAGRGGFGSKLVQEHGICAIIYGGTFVDDDFRDRKVADAWFQRRYDKRMKLKDREATTKYRFDPAFGTGGTFGVNYAKMGGGLMAFNYRSLVWTEAQREEFTQRTIWDHYLKQFNEETIEPKQQKTCGEPCIALCKKMRDQYKKDYEPYHAMGPQIGVFDQRAAERVVHHADGLGFDSISVGGVLSWLMDCVDQKLLGLKELGLPHEPVFDPEGFDPEKDSATNADVAVTLLNGIIERQGPLDLRHGARALAHRLAEQRGDQRFVDLLVVTAFGERGWMVPNQYWTPGILAPMPAMGRYYQYYGQDHTDPTELGRASATRMAREMMIDNSGFCRFHRGWCEEMLPGIYKELFGDAIDLIGHHEAQARRLASRNMGIPWEGSGSIELVRSFLSRRHDVFDAEHPTLEGWIERFQSEPRAAALDYWYEIHKGVTEALVLGGRE